MEDIKKTQIKYLESKSIICKMKTTWVGITHVLDIAQEKIVNLKTAKETTHNETNKEEIVV